MKVCGRHRDLVRRVAVEHESVEVRMFVRTQGRYFESYLERTKVVMTEPLEHSGLRTPDGSCAERAGLMGG